MNINFYHSKRAQEGQVLLLLIMLIATVITVVMTLTFKAQTDTQVSKLNEESQKALAAAEAGIEASIRIDNNTTSTYTALGINNLSGIDPSQSTVQVVLQRAPQFVSPLIEKDQVYTYYLANYDGTTVTGAPPVATLNLYYGSEGACNTLALELDVLSGSNTLTRYISDAGSILGQGSGVYQNTPATFSGVQFRCRANIPVPADGKLLFIHVISSNSGTRIGTNDGRLPPQGKYIYSEAKTTTGVVKKVQLFQSFPQIPSEVFLTSFSIN